MSYGREASRDPIRILRKVVVRATQFRFGTSLAWMLDRSLGDKISSDLTTPDEESRVTTICPTNVVMFKTGNVYTLSVYYSLYVAIMCRSFTQS